MSLLMFKYHDHMAHVRETRAEKAKASQIQAETEADHNTEKKLHADEAYVLRC